MKALVISDSHGAQEDLRALMILSEKQIKPDALIFCGDGINDVIPYRQAVLQFWPVRGNCDLTYPPGIPLERTERMETLWVYIAHGHTHRVKNSLLPLYYRAQEVGARVACFGHTHSAMARWEGGILLLNPGSLRDGRYAVLEIGEQGEVKAELACLN